MTIAALGQVDWKGTSVFKGYTEAKHLRKKQPYARPLKSSLGYLVLFNPSQ